MRRLLPLCLGILLATAAVAADPPAPVEVRLTASTLTPYVGEEVLLTLEIRTRRIPPQPLRPLWPECADAGVEELPFPPPQRGTDAAGPFLLQQVSRALVPFRSGTLTIAGAGVEGGGDTLRAAPLRLRVRPLPTAGQPEHFGGGVGQGTLTLHGAGQGTREISVTLLGTGALHQAPPPTWHLGRGEQVVPLGEEQNGAPGSERQRTWRYLYLPGAGRTGDARCSLTLFDPHLGRYRSLRAGLAGEWRLAGPLLAAGILAALLCAWWLRRQRHNRSLDAALAAWLGEPVAGLPQQQIRRRLLEAGLSADLLAQLEDLWQEERPRFAPAPPPPGAPLSDPRMLARALRRALRKAIDKRRRIH